MWNPLILDPAAVSITSFPTSVEPVKAILSISGCAAIACPADGPSPGTIFTTPSGKPA